MGYHPCQLASLLSHLSVVPGACPVTAPDDCCPSG